MQFNYTPNALYAQIHNDPNPFIFSRGPVGCGKTSGSVVHTFFLAHNQEPNREGVRQRRTAVIRATAPRLQTTVMKTYEQWFGDVDAGKGGLLKFKRSSPLGAKASMPSIYNDGTVLEWEICFLALDREEDVEILKSQEFSDMYFCETMEMKKNIYDAGRGRMGRFPAVKDGCACTNPQIICDYNSPPIDHWLAKLELEERPTKHSFYVAPPAVIQVDGLWVPNENALNLEFLPGGTEYYENQLYGADEQYINVMLANNFGTLKSEHRVFSNYEDSTHASDITIRPLQGVPLVIGLDAGLTPAAAICQLSPMGQLLVLDEIVAQDCGMSQFIDHYLKPKMQAEYSNFNYTVFVDPAATQRAQTDMKSCYDILRQSGIPTQTARSNKLVDRIDGVDYFLRRFVDGGPGFRLSPKCSTIRRGLISEYKFKKVVGQDRYHAIPDKNSYSHVMDALQYACMELAAPRTQRMSRLNRIPRKRFKPASSVAGY